MCRLTPGGSAGVVTDGLGRRSAFRALATLVRSASSRPASPAAAATPAVATLAARKLLRAGFAGPGALEAPATQSRPCAADGLITPPGPPGRPAPRPAGPAAARPGRPAATSGAPGIRGAAARPAPAPRPPRQPSPARPAGRRPGPTRLISTRSTIAAAAVAARVGSRSATVAVGRVAAAVSPMTANTARPAMP